MKYRYEYDKCLDKGELAEDLFADIVINKNGKFIYEMKADCKVHETENLFFEFKHLDKESGLKTTKADWWIIAIPKTHVYKISKEKIELFIVIKTIELKKTLNKLLKEGKAVKKRGGDNNEFLGVLVKIENLILELIKEKKTLPILFQKKSPHKESFQQELENILKG